VIRPPRSGCLWWGVGPSTSRRWGGRLPAHRDPNWRRVAGGVGTPSCRCGGSTKRRRPFGETSPLWPSGCDWSVRVQEADGSREGSGDDRHRPGRRSALEELRGRHQGVFVSAHIRSTVSGRAALAPARRAVGTGGHSRRRSWMHQPLATPPCRRQASGWAKGSAARLLLLPCLRRGAGAVGRVPVPRETSAATRGLEPTRLCAGRHALTGER